jgi:hypothetical protein
VFEEKKWANEGVWARDKNLVLDDDIEFSALRLDEGKQDEVWGLVMKELELPESCEAEDENSVVEVLYFPIRTQILFSRFRGRQYGFILHKPHNS